MGIEYLDDDASPVTSSKFEYEDETPGYWEKTAKNILPDLEGLTQDLGGPLAQIGNAIPGVAPLTTLAQQAPKAYQMATHPKETLKELARPVTDFKNYTQEHPVSQGLNMLGALGMARAGAAGLGKGLNAVPLTENIVPTVERVANNQTLKSLSGSMGQIKQMAKSGQGGRGALDTAANYAREKGLTDIFSTSMGRDKILEGLKSSTGETIGALRKEAGPAPAGIPEKIAMELEAKYGKGGLKSPQIRNVKRALEDVKRISGEGQAPELPVVDASTIKGEPKAVFAYNQSDLSGAGGPEVSMYKIGGDHPNSGSQMTLPQLKEAGIPVVGREARSVGKWEPLDLETPPTHAGYSKAATFLNEEAAANKLYQPQTAATDVANKLSRENNAGIVQSLGADKGKQYLDVLKEQQSIHPLEHLQQHGELKELRSGGPVGLDMGLIQKLSDAAGYRLSAKTMGKIHELLSNEAALSGKELGKSAGLMAPAELNAFLEDKHGKKK